MPEFSIVIIARNESHSISRLADSLAPFLKLGGDVVLLDTGSTDNTVDLALGAGFQTYLIGDKFRFRLSSEQADLINRSFVIGEEQPLVVEGQSVFDFSSARQYAAGLAKKDFVFHLDASDVLMACDVEYLDQAIAAGRTGNFDYTLELVSQNHGVGTVSLWISRFYDRRYYHWEGLVHEGVYPHPKLPDLQRMYCDISTLLVRHLKDENKTRPSYGGGLALAALANPDNPRWVHYLGRELYYLGSHRSAIKLLERHAHMDFAWNAERCESLCLTGICYEALGDLGSASECYSRAFEIDSSRREPLLRRAELFQKQGDDKKAADSALAALKIDKKSGYMELDSNYTYRPHMILYKCLARLGNKEEALLHLERCLFHAPANEEFQLELKKLIGK